MIKQIKLSLYKLFGKCMRQFPILKNFETDHITIDTKAEYITYVFWTGNNAITENRQRCLNKLKEGIDVDLKLVTAEKLHLFEHENFPFHPAYEFLSYNHRSDYLRCYFMHVYGGAYSDIKENLHSWRPCFNRLNNSDKWILGYPEIAPSGAAAFDTNVKKILRINYYRLIGNGCFICKPQTPLTTEWFKRVNQLLDENFELLKENPGNMWGDNIGYPLRWAAVQGEIFHPLIYEFRNKVMHDERMILSFKNYK